MLRARRHRARRLIYYLLPNHLYTVINRFAIDGLVDEDTLLDVVRSKTTTR